MAMYLKDIVALKPRLRVEVDPTNCLAADVDCNVTIRVKINNQPWSFCKVPLHIYNMTKYNEVDGKIMLILDGLYKIERSQKNHDFLLLKVREDAGQDSSSDENVL